MSCERKAVGKADIATCLDLAQRIEETSVEVYGQMRRAYAERFSEVLTRIVGEEAQHLRMVHGARSRI
jgi:rubrerythrin